MVAVVIATTILVLNGQLLATIIGMSLFLVDLVIITVTGPKMGSKSLGCVLAEGALYIACIAGSVVEMAAEELGSIEL